jgi:hypothetical protein
MVGRFGLRLVLERVLDLLARVLEARLRLVDLALVLGALVSGHLAESLFGLAAYVVDLVACLVSGAHNVFPSIGSIATQDRALVDPDTAEAVIRNAFSL